MFHACQINHLLLRVHLIYAAESRIWSMVVACISLETIHAPITAFHECNIIHDRYVTYPFCFYFHSHAIEFRESREMCKYDKKSVVDSKWFVRKINCRHLSTLLREKITSALLLYGRFICWGFSFVLFPFFFFVQYLFVSSFILETDRVYAFVSFDLFTFCLTGLVRSFAYVSLCECVMPIHFSLAYLSLHEISTAKIQFGRKLSMTNMKLFVIFYTLITKMIIIGCISSSSIFRFFFFFRSVWRITPNVCREMWKNRNLNKEEMISHRNPHFFGIKWR